MGVGVSLHEIQFPHSSLLGGLSAFLYIPKETWLGGGTEEFDLPRSSA